VVLRELGETLDVDEALRQILEGHVMPSTQEQATELVELLARVSEASRQEVRRAGFELAAQLFLGGPWEHVALGQGLDCFFDECFSDLCLDLPALPTIVTEDLSPVLVALVVAGVLDASRRDRWMAIASELRVA